MLNGSQPTDAMEQEALAQAQAELAATFEKMPHEVPLILLTSPGIYTAGDVEGGYKQIVTAAGQGSEAALAIFEDLVNPYWKSKTEKAAV